MYLDKNIDTISKSLLPIRYIDICLYMYVYYYLYINTTNQKHVNCGYVWFGELCMGDSCFSYFSTLVK